MRVQIRKYENRKLYNPDTRSYVSMLELSDLVAGGGKVSVICDRTGDDITLETLARSLYERAKVCSKGDAQSQADKIARIIATMVVNKDGTP
jgi:polyhydroxyalkanoate synthesis regulator protein